jgi:hypothetical protein
MRISAGSYGFGFGAPFLRGERSASRSWSSWNGAVNLMMRQILLCLDFEESEKTSLSMSCQGRLAIQSDRLLRLRSDLVGRG